MRLFAIAFLGMVSAASAAEQFRGIAEAGHQDPSRPSRPFSLVFQGVTYVAAFQHNSGADWFLEMTPPGKTVDTWQTLLVVHWYPQEKGAPVDATRRLASTADQADARARAVTTESASTQEALVAFHAYDGTRQTHEGSVFKFGRTVSGRGLVAVQYSVRFDAAMTPAASDRALRRSVEAVKRFDLGQVSLVNGRWGEVPPERTVSIEPSSAGALR